MQFIEVLFCQLLTILLQIIDNSILLLNEIPLLIH